jgi:hypothetical protein
MRYRDIAESSIAVINKDAPVSIWRTVNPVGKSYLVIDVYHNNRVFYYNLDFIVRIRRKRYRHIVYRRAIQLAPGLRLELEFIERGYKTKLVGIFIAIAGANEKPEVF